VAIEERAASVRSAEDRRFGGLIPRLFQPIDNASVAFFRIAFGLTCFFHIWGILELQRIQNRLRDAPFLMSYPGLGWLPRLPGDLMLVVYFSLAGAAVLIMLGLFYKPAIIFFFVAHTYVIHLDQSLAWNHYYLVTLFAFLMIFIPRKQRSLAGRGLARPARGEHSSRVGAVGIARPDGADLFLRGSGQAQL